MTILAILQLISGIILVISAIGIGAISIMGENSIFGQFTAVLGGIITAITLVPSVFSFVIAAALFNGKGWARTLVIVRLCIFLL